MLRIDASDQFVELEYRFASSILLGIIAQLPDRLRRHPGSRLFPPPFVDYQTRFCLSWPAQCPMLDSAGGSEPYSFIDSDNSTVPYQAREHRTSLPT
jgi:hypothetical protein